MMAAKHLLRRLNQCRPMFTTSRFISPHPDCLVHSRCISYPSLNGASPIMVSSPSYRHYSTEHRNNQDEDPRIQGTVLHVPNPVKLLKTKLLTFLIRNTVDPGFTIEEFTNGARQAILYFTKLMSGHQYGEMKSISSPEVIESVRGILFDMTEDMHAAVEITEQDVQITTPTITGYQNTDAGTKVDLDVFLLAVKVHANHPLLFELILRFSRVYGQQSSSGWIIEEMSHFKMREINH